MYPPPTQLGSIPKSSSASALLLYRTLLRKAQEAELTVYSMQIYLNKAYNRVNRTILWVMLQQMQVGPLLILAIMSTYEVCEDTIMLGGTAFDAYSLLKGLRQGSVLSPLLFILYVTPLLLELNGTGTGIPTGTTANPLIPAIMFVDDLRTLATSPAEMIAQYETTQYESLLQNL